MKKIALLPLLVFALMFASCGNGTVPGELKVEISQVGWYYKNISTDWQSMKGWTNSGSTAFFTFSLWYEGEAIQPDELTSFKAEADGVTFNVPVVDSIFLDSSSDPNKHGFDCYYTWRVGDNTHYMPLGPWTFTLEFIDGSQTVYTHTFNKPGTNEVIDNTFFITEGFGVGDATHFPMIQRASVENASISGTTLDVDFNIDDSMVKSGWIWVYTDAGEYVGVTERFVEDGVISNKLNSGAVFNTEGSNNTFTFDLTTDLSNPVTTNGNYRVVVVLIDGNHYSGDYYDGMSYSQTEGFTY